MSRDVSELVRDAASGDASAFDALVDRFASLVWSITRSHRLSSADAADVSQTVWLRLVEQLDRIREPARLAGWLATTARNECLAVQRSRQRTQVTDFDEPGGDALVHRGSVALARGGVVDATTSGEHDRVLLAAERDQLLWQAFAELSERCQELLRLLMLDPPADYHDISAALDMPIGSIGPTRMRCLERLRQHPVMERLA